MASVANLDQVLTMAKRLSTVDKVRLIDRLAPQIEQDLTAMRPTSYKSLYGVLADHTVAQAMINIPRTEVPDLPDRMIAATADQLDVPVISRDRVIQASRVRTIW